MTTTSTISFVRGQPPRRRLSVHEYHRMLETGILKSGEPYELLDGILVLKNRSAKGEDPMSIGPERMWAVNNLARIGRQLHQFGCFMQTQGPVIMSDFDEPEPDGAIVIGSEDDFKTTKPRAINATCVIEVADSSLADDRGAKLAAYADSGIKQYVIINLVDRLVEIYSQPQVGRGRFGHVETLQPGTTVQFALPGGQFLPVPVQTLLP